MEIGGEVDMSNGMGTDGVMEEGENMEGAGTTVQGWRQGGNGETRNRNGTGEDTSTQAGR